MAHHATGRTTSTDTPDQSAVVARNREQQTAVYGEPLGNLLGRVGEQLGLTQARMAAVLGLSAPMLSQLASAHRVKIGNPAAMQRLQALSALGAAVAGGQVPLADVESRLTEIAAQSAVVTRSTASTTTAAPASVVRAIQGLLRAVAGAEELLDAAALIEPKHPEIATLLRVYGAGRTADAVAHFEANAHLL